MKDGIELKNIYKKFGKKEILKDFNEKFVLGEITAITGKSGAGKSTLLNIIGLLENMDSGEVNILGTAIADVNCKEATLLRRYKLGYVFQNFALMENETVFNNLMLALEYVNIKKDEKSKIISETLDGLGLLGYEKQFVYELSGGEQQRVAMARIAIKPCEIILADEPTASLDKDNKEIIVNAFKKFKDLNKTIIIATHDMDLAALCDRVIKI